MKDTQPKTYADLAHLVASILPDATIGEDNDGQLVVYTNLTEDPKGNLIDMDD